MKYLTWPNGLRAQIALARSVHGDSCQLHRPGRRELGLVARRFWKMSPSESTASFNFPAPTAPARAALESALEKIRLKLAGKPKNRKH